MTGSLDAMLREAVGPLLAELSFKKRQGQIYTLEVADDVLGWLGLNLATEHYPRGVVEVNPMVAVRHQGVERLVAELLGENFHPYVPPTVGTPLSYLMPEAYFRTWVLGGPDTAERARDMAAAVTRYGLPWMRAGASLQTLCRSLIEGDALLEHEEFYRRPVALLLAGDVAGAAAWLDRLLAEVGDDTDAFSVEFRGFAAALRYRLAEAPCSD